VSPTGATLSGSYAGASSTPTASGFKWGTSSGNLNNTVNNTSASSGTLSAPLSNLTPGTTYYYKAFVTVSGTGDYESQSETFYGDVQSFTTVAVVLAPGTGWLELPEVTGSEDFVGKLYGSGSAAGANRNYSYSYDESYYASLWVAYPLCSTHKSGSASTSTWRYNPYIDNSDQVSIVSNSYGTVYNASAYARGHQCPNASRKSDEQMNLQTYYATNQTPQLQNKFNGAIWGSLEGAVRDLATSQSDTVYVVTGPAYRKVTDGKETINYLHGASGQNANPSDLPIPNYYWKALLKVKRNGSGEVTSAKTIGFWFDHREYESSEHYYDTEHVVSVDQIEEWTGLNLFHNLPGNETSGIEQSAESNTSWSSFQSF